MRNQRHKETPQNLDIFYNMEFIETQAVQGWVEALYHHILHLLLKRCSDLA